jgi:predicted negative regulator of RcsB-dependent stress response
MKNWTRKEGLELLQALSLIVGLFFVGYQVKCQSVALDNQTRALQVQTETLKLQAKTLQDSEKINSATFVLKIRDELNRAKYDKLTVL